MNTKIIIYALLCIFSISVSSPVSAGLFGDKETPAEEREQILAERADILEKMFEDQPALKKKVDEASGYATFSVLNVNLLVLATARGTGVAVDNKTNKETFMKMTSIGGGLGAGLKDMNILIIFNEPDALDEFMNSGWQFEAQADAAAKSGDKGGEIGEGVTVTSPDENGAMGTSMSSTSREVASAPMEIYKLTEAGVSAQATISGVKFSKDDDLN